ncbi:hypothetical protein FHT77_004231 [Rhizobium sp. BK181]|nr:hypothetical protein [Rhizobium sp. BK181]MCS3742208.1 hypothetical protein [Rhizobium sp. BK661]
MFQEKADLVLQPDAGFTLRLNEAWSSIVEK